MKLGCIPIIILLPSCLGGFVERGAGEVASVSLAFGYEFTILFLAFDTPLASVSPVGVFVKESEDEAVFIS